MPKYIIFFIFLVSCNLASLDTKKSGIHKNSQSIEESKEKGVFQFRLKVKKPIFLVGTNLTDTVREIWVEKMWMYADNGDILKDSTDQLLILLGNSSESFNDKLRLIRKSGYLGWNRVFFSSYNNSIDTIYVTSIANASENILDTIFINK
jgi:hypothetical protein